MPYPMTLVRKWIQQGSGIWTQFADFTFHVDISYTIHSNIKDFIRIIIPDIFLFVVALLRIYSTFYLLYPPSHTDLRMFYLFCMFTKLSFWINFCTIDFLKRFRVSFLGCSRRSYSSDPHLVLQAFLYIKEYFLFNFLSFFSPKFSCFSFSAWSKRRRHTLMEIKFVSISLSWWSNPGKSKFRLKQMHLSNNFASIIW